MDAKENMTILVSYIKSLSSEPNITATQLRDCIEMLIKIYKNVFQFPTNDKCKKIRVSNDVFHRRVWRYPSAQKFLINSGWTVEVDNDDSERPQVIRYNENAEMCNIKECIDILVENRMVPPNHNEWTPHNKLIMGNEEKLKETERRRKAAEERDEELRKYREDIEERKRNAEMIKRHIQDDNKYRKEFPRFYADKPQPNERDDSQIPQQNSPEINRCKNDVRTDDTKSINNLSDQ